MKFIHQSIPLVLALCTPLAICAGDRVGNGGDGIKFTDTGRIVLFDFYERGINEETSLDLNLEVNPAIRNSLPDLGALNDPETRSVVERALTRLSWDHAALVFSIVTELSQLQFLLGPTDLLPNPDTEPSLDLSEATPSVKRIGCARNTHGSILISPICTGEQMDALNKAGLVVHEAVYSIYRRLNPTADRNSYPVRTVTAALFAFSTFDMMSIAEDSRLLTLEETLTRSGLGALLEESHQIRQLFFDGNAYSLLNRFCAFESGTKVEIRFSGMLNVTGSVQLAGAEAPILIEGTKPPKTGVQPKPRSMSHSARPAGHSAPVVIDEAEVTESSVAEVGVENTEVEGPVIWSPSLPEFLAESKTISIGLFAETDESLRVYLMRDGSDLVFIEGYNTETEDETGICAGSWVGAVALLDQLPQRIKAFEDAEDAQDQ